jgi:hypothetical protein
VQSVREIEFTSETRHSLELKVVRNSFLRGSFRSDGLKPRPRRISQLLMVRVRRRRQRRRRVESRRPTEARSESPNYTRLPPPQPPQPPKATFSLRDEQRTLSLIFSSAIVFGPRTLDRFYIHSPPRGWQKTRPRPPRPPRPFVNFCSRSFNCL